MTFGVTVLDFGILWQNAVIIIMTSQAVQFLGTRLAGLPRFDPLSALITSLSLTMLLRTELITLAAAAAVIAIGSCVTTWSMRSEPQASDDSTVVSEIGEHWSPNTAPPMIAPKANVTYSGSDEIA